MPKDVKVSPCPARPMICTRAKINCWMGQFMPILMEVTQRAMSVMESSESTHETPCYWDLLRPVVYINRLKFVPTRIYINPFFMEHSQISRPDNDSGLLHCVSCVQDIPTSEHWRIIGGNGWRSCRWKRSQWAGGRVENQLHKFNELRGSYRNKIWGALRTMSLLPQGGTTSKVLFKQLNYWNLIQGAYSSSWVTCTIDIN